MRTEEEKKKAERIYIERNNMQYFDARAQRLSVQSVAWCFVFPGFSPQIQNSYIYLFRL